MIKYKCEKCNVLFDSKRGLINHQKRKVPCDTYLSCDICDEKFNTNYSFMRHKNKKNPCGKKEKRLSINDEKRFSFDDEIKMLEKKKEIELEILKKKKEMELEILEKKKEIDFLIEEKKLELLEKKSELDLKKLEVLEKKSEIDFKKIEMRKDKDLLIEDKKLERKKQVSQHTTNNYIASQVNLHFPAANIISATYENCMEKIVSPFIERIRDGSYHSYQLVYQSSLDKFEIATTILKDIFQDEKCVNTHNMIYLTDQDIFMVVLQKAWVSKHFDYIAKIINDTFKRCFSAMKRRIGEPIRGNFISEKAFNKAEKQYADIDELSNTDISVEYLEEVSKEGLNIDDILSGKKLLLV